MIDNDIYQSLNVIRDTYLAEKCAVCFKDYDINDDKYKFIYVIIVVLLFIKYVME